MQTVQFSGMTIMTQHPITVSAKNFAGKAQEDAASVAENEVQEAKGIQQQFRGQAAKRLGEPGKVAGRCCRRFRDGVQRRSVSDGIGLRWRV
jgi:uncharacterized protein YjbJ (UPF0337 family)